LFQTSSLSLQMGKDQLLNDKIMKSTENKIILYKFFINFPYIGPFKNIINFCIIFF